MYKKKLNCNKLELHYEFFLFRKCNFNTLYVTFHETLKMRGLYIIYGKAGLMYNFI